MSKHSHKGSHGKHDLEELMETREATAAAHAELAKHNILLTSGSGAEAKPQSPAYIKQLDDLQRISRNSNRAAEQTMGQWQSPLQQLMGFQLEVAGMVLQSWVELANAMTSVKMLPSAQTENQKEQ